MGTMTENIKILPFSPVRCAMCRRIQALAHTYRKVCFRDTFSKTYPSLKDSSVFCVGNLPFYYDKPMFVFLLTYK